MCLIILGIFIYENSDLSYLKIPISGFRDGRFHNIVIKIINKIRSLYHLTPEFYQFNAAFHVTSLSTVSQYILSYFVVNR